MRPNIEKTQGLQVIELLLLDVQMIVSEVFEYMVQGPELNSNLLCNYLFSRMLYILNT